MKEIRVHPCIAALVLRWLLLCLLSLQHRSGSTSGGTASPRASVESPPSVSEEDEVDDSPSPELGGRVVPELRWLGETSVVQQGRTRGEQR